MKKSFLIMLLALAGAVFVSASSSRASVTGYVQMYGNAPVVFAGIVTDNGKVYAINTDNDVELYNKIVEAQGKHIVLTGKIAKSKNGKIGFEELKDGVIVVDSFDFVSEEESK